METSPPGSPRPPAHTPLTPYQCFYAGGITAIASLLAYRTIPRGLWQKVVSGTILTGGTVYLIRDQKPEFRALFDGYVKSVWNSSKVKQVRGRWNGSSTTTIGGSEVRLDTSYTQDNKSPLGSPRGGLYEERGQFDKDKK